MKPGFRKVTRVVTGPLPECRTWRKFEALKQQLDSSATGTAHIVMMMRGELGKIAGWHGPVSSEAISLARAIEIAADASLTDHKGAVTWSLQVWDSELVHFRLERDNARGSCKAQSDKLEAALSLQLHSVRQREQGLERNGTLPRAGNDKGVAWLRAQGTLHKP